MSSQLREGFYGPPLLVKIIAALSAVASPRELSQLATQAPFVERQMFRSQFIVRGVVDAGLRFLVKLVELTDYDPSTTLRMVQENGHAHAVQALQDAQVRQSQQWHMFFSAYLGHFQRTQGIPKYKMGL